MQGSWQSSGHCWNQDGDKAGTGGAGTDTATLGWHPMTQGLGGGAKLGGGLDALLEEGQS